MSDKPDTRVGNIIHPNDTRERDAIHVAVIPVIAGAELRPGDKLIMDRDGKVRGAFGTPGIGVVDPYLQGPVAEGERFLLFLYPGSIRSLRHEWSSDIFPLADEERGEGVVVSHFTMRASEIWLHEFARDNHNSRRQTAEEYYQELISGENVPDVHGETRARELSDHGADELWMHVENVTGRRTTPAQRQHIFSCWC